jgi:hypothetical protein
LNASLGHTLSSQVPPETIPEGTSHFEGSFLFLRVVQQQMYCISNRQKAYQQTKNLSDCLLFLYLASAEKCTKIQTMADT